jgi:hypothetical protein
LDETRHTLEFRLVEIVPRFAEVRGHRLFERRRRESAVRGD